MSACDLLLLYGDSRKAALLGVAEHVERSSSKSFLPVTVGALSVVLWHRRAVTWKCLVPLVLCLFHPELREAAMSSWRVECQGCVLYAFVPVLLGPCEPEHVLV